ncbi:MAG: hypothetical protein HC925_02430, partial [Coleofasciculaceae cyanobacterium SM2_3_26]|nr:hypothetical protein [Coleofasciculaceae cyanobacterium SM2_3_26]
MKGMKRAVVLALVLGLAVPEVRLVEGVVLAQGVSVAERRAEADRLINQGIQQYQTSQFRAALQSWQRALEI